MPEVPEAWQGDAAPFRSTWPPTALGRKWELFEDRLLEILRGISLETVIGGEV